MNAMSIARLLDLENQIQDYSVTTAPTSQSEKKRSDLWSCVLCLDLDLELLEKLAYSIGELGFMSWPGRVFPANLLTPRACGGAGTIHTNIIIITQLC
jgi:hypothetical protein